MPKDPLRFEFNPKTRRFAVFIGIHRTGITGMVANVLHCACHVPPDNLDAAESDQVRTVNLDVLASLCRNNGGPMKRTGVDTQLSALSRICMDDAEGRVRRHVEVMNSNPHGGGKTLVVRGRVVGCLPLSGLPRHSPPVSIENMLDAYRHHVVPEVSGIDNHWVNYHEGKVLKSVGTQTDVVWRAWCVAHALSRRRIILLRRGEIKAAEKAMERVHAMLGYISLEYRGGIELVLLVGSALQALIMGLKNIASEKATEVLLTPTAGSYLLANAHLVLAHTTFAKAAKEKAGRKSGRSGSSAVEALERESEDHAKQSLSIAWAIKDYDTALEAVSCLGSLEVSFGLGNGIGNSGRTQLQKCADHLSKKVALSNERVSLRAEIMAANFALKFEWNKAEQTVEECEAFYKKHRSKIGRYQVLLVKKARLDFEIARFIRNVPTHLNAAQLEISGQRLIEEWDQSYGPNAALKSLMTKQLNAAIRFPKALTKNLS